MNKKSAPHRSKAPIKRRVFYSFHYKRDVRRVARIRQIGRITGNGIKANRPATSNDWEKLENGGNKDIKRWIDGQMQGRTCLVVFVGKEIILKKTVRLFGIKLFVTRKVRPWIEYEIKKAWEDGLGVMGIRIHNLKDTNGVQDSPGDNPFKRIKCKDGNPLHPRVTLHDPKGGKRSEKVYANISENLARWIEDAITDRRKHG